MRSGVESWKQTLAELARNRLASLIRQAFLLCGDQGQAEDLVQDALVRAFARPLRTPRPGAAEAYVRAIMVNNGAAAAASLTRIDAGLRAYLAGGQAEEGPAGFEAADHYVAADPAGQPAGAQ